MQEVTTWVSRFSPAIAAYQLVKVPEDVHADEAAGEGAAHVRRVRDCVVTVSSAVGVPVVDGQGNVKGGDEERQGAARKEIHYIKRALRWPKHCVSTLGSPSGGGLSEARRDSWAVVTRQTSPH